MSEKPKQSPFPFRPTPEIREAVSRLSAERDRSVNWTLNELVRHGLVALEAQKKMPQLL